MWLFAASIEKVGDVGIFFGFGDMGLVDVKTAEVVGESVSGMLWGEGDESGDGTVILSHGDDFEVFGGCDDLGNLVSAS